MQDFNFKMPTLVVFGIGASLKTADLCKEWGCARAFVVSGPNMAKAKPLSQLIENLVKNGINCTVYTDVCPEPTVEKVDQSATVLKNSGCDIVIAVGGGSTIDIAKAMTMLQTNEGSVRDYLFGGIRSVTRPLLPLIAVATTAGSGSEVTASSVITDHQHSTKLSVTHEYLMPRAALIDPLLHVGMPPFITATTGMDALTHAIEAYVSMDSNPISDAYAVEAIRLIAANLKKAVHFPQDMEARSGMAVASLLAGLAFSNGGLGAVHGISQSMGGIAHVAHGLGNAVMLPYVMERNIEGRPDRFAEIAHLLGEKTDSLAASAAAQKGVQAVRDLCADLKIPLKMRDVGITEAMLPNIVKETMKYRLLPQNPVVLDRQDVYAILRSAF